jgi:hypothetical protein
MSLLGAVSVWRDDVRSRSSGRCLMSSPSRWSAADSISGSPGVRESEAACIYKSEAQPRERATHGTFELAARFCGTLVVGLSKQSWITAAFLWGDIVGRYRSLPVPLGYRFVPDRGRATRRFSSVFARCPAVKRLSPRTIGRLRPTSRPEDYSNAAKCRAGDFSRIGCVARSRFRLIRFGA